MSCMFSNVPNFAVVFGYLNASWTLRADIVAEYVCRVLNHMQDKGAEVATPILEDPASLTEENIFDFSSGYIQRALHIMPKNAVDLPWRLSQRSEEHTSELQSLMRISYAVFCLKNKKQYIDKNTYTYRSTRNKKTHQ